MRFLFFIAMFFLCACNGLSIEKTALKDLPDEPPQDAQPAPIGFSEIRFAVPTGTPTISQSPKGALGLISCDWPYAMVQQGIRSRNLPDDNFKSLFLRTLKGQGYDVTGDPGRFFDEFEDEMRTVYAIGGQIVDVKIDICHQTNIWGIAKGDRGESSVTINWTIFDTLNRRRVYKTQTKGYGKLETPNHEGVQLLFESAVESAIHNLGADPNLHSLVFYGEQPKAEFETIIDQDEQYMGMFDPNETVLLAKTKNSVSPAEGRFESIRKNVVMVQAGRSHGSGFFVTKNGHIVTNAHVVGNAKRVRVVTSLKKEKLKAEVLRVDRRRDVALLRLEEIPDDLKITILPVRTDQPKVGETVYAVGAPRLKKLQDTVTSGIISAHRYDRKEKQHYIQADVDTYGGNSGGPLLDKNGNIIGISVLGYYVSTDTLGGLNWFIPIEDALEKLNIGTE